MDKLRAAFGLEGIGARPRGRYQGGCSGDWRFSAAYPDGLRKHHPSSRSMRQNLVFLTQRMVAHSYAETLVLETPLRAGFLTQPRIKRRTVDSDTPTFRAIARPESPLEAS